MYKYLCPSPLCAIYCATMSHRIPHPSHFPPNGVLTPPHSPILRPVSPKETRFKALRREKAFYHYETSQAYQQENDPQHHNKEKAR